MTTGNEKEAAQQEPPKTSPPATAPAPSSGRAAFRDIKKQLTDEELSSSGTQKLLLDMLLTAEGERDEYKAYVAMYYKAQEDASVLKERAKPNKINETLFAVGVGIGGSILGLAPFFWSTRDPQHGQICLFVGLFLVIGATVGRILFR
jgi:hypothetical protein